jgi:hypothetical protein
MLRLGNLADRSSSYDICFQSVSMQRALSEILTKSK